MFEAILILHVLIAAAVVVLVLLNQGKGADMGAAFGSGASNTVFGARGAASFMTRLIAGLGTLFFVTSLTLAILAARGVEESASVVGGDDPDAPAQEERPADAPDAPDDPDAMEVPDADERVAPAPDEPTDESNGDQ